MRKRNGRKLHSCKSVLHHRWKDAPGLMSERGIWLKPCLARLQAENHVSFFSLIFYNFL